MENLDVKHLVKYKQGELSLLNAFLQPDISLIVPSLIIEGPPSSGKTVTVTKYLKYLKDNHDVDSIIIECEYCFTQREILKKLHKKLMVYYGLASLGESGDILTVDTISSFPLAVKKIHQKYLENKNIKSFEDEKPLIIVFDKIDTLPAYENPGDLIKCLSKLYELEDSGNHSLDRLTFVSIVTRSENLDISTSSIPIVKFKTYSLTEFKDIIHGEYFDKFWNIANFRSRQNTGVQSLGNLDVIDNNGDDDSDENDNNNNNKNSNKDDKMLNKFINNWNFDETFAKGLFKQFVDIILDTYESYIGISMEVIIPILRRLWPLFIDPIINKGKKVIKGQNDIFTSFMKNKLLLSKEFSVVTKLDNSEILLDYYENENENKNKNNNKIYKSFENLNEDQSGHYDLSIKTKYLVIASYLASYNESKFDSQFFSKGNEYTSIMKRSKYKRAKKIVRGDGKLRRDMSAAAPFKLERLLAILNSIWKESLGDEKLIDDVELMSEIATLSSLKTLIKIKGGDTIGGQTKWKCNVHWNVVKKFSNDVGYEIENHLQN